MSQADTRNYLQGLARIIVYGTREEKDAIADDLRKMTRQHKIWLSDEMGMLELQKKGSA